MTNAWYADPRKNIYLCPTVGPVGMKRGLSYSMNYHLDDQSTVLMGVRVSQIRNPAKKILLVDESEMTLNDGSFIPTGHENDIADLDGWLRHAGGTNLLFCDGHIDWIEATKLLQIMNRDDPEWFDPYR